MLQMMTELVILGVIVGVAFWCGTAYRDTQIDEVLDTYKQQKKRVKKVITTGNQNTFKTH